MANYTSHEDRITMQFAANSDLLILAAHVIRMKQEAITGHAILRTGDTERMMCKARDNSDRMVRKLRDLADRIEKGA